jgi:hypothetical protein
MTTAQQRRSRRPQAGWYGCRGVLLTATLAGVLLLASSPAGAATSRDTYLQCLTNFEAYAETIWHTATYSGAPADAGYWGDGGSSGNGGIRGNSGVAVAYAVLVMAQPSNAKNTTRLAHLRQALNYDTATHITGTNLCVDGKKWGWSSTSSGEWQTPLWSGSMGLACLLVQSQLPTTTVQAVQRVLASEATFRAGVAPASGYVGDTKAEENGWDSNVLALSAAWMSTNTNALLWLNAAKAYLANTYTVANTSGDMLSSWVTTVTLYPSYALENHGFFHPTYEMVAGMSLGDSLLMARLANPDIAALLRPFAEHNVLSVWTNALTATLFDSGEFAYPAGLDWELHDYEQNSYIAWLATHFNDPLARWADGQLAQLVLTRQLVNGNGQFVGPSGGGFYREAVEARRTAIAWLHWANADFPTGPSSPPGPSFKHFPEVSIILQRSPYGFTSISYGPQTNGSSPRIMAMVEAPAPTSFPTNVFVASPLVPGLLGLGALGNPTAARLVNLTTNSNGFQAEFQLTNGNNGITEVYVNCTGEALGIVEVPFPAAGIAGGSAGSFNTGIENDPLCGGSRLLEWDGGSAILTNRSGAARNITNHWLCVSGRYGLAAGPAGYFKYQAASSYNRSGAAQDTLSFITQDQLGPRYAVYFPGKNALETSAKASLIQWSVTASNCVLSFPDPAGSTVQIVTAPLPPPPAYPPYSLPVASITASSAQSGYPPTNAVDGNLADFWVSSGSTPGQGPTTNHPEWLFVTFPRCVAVSHIQVYPRSYNSGYGPKDIQLLLNGASVYQGTMAPTATLDVPLAPPAYATNAELYITSSYDPANPTNSRNVQVMELTFMERAQPGTYGDWALRQFTDAQLTNSALGTVTADPDHDGVPNLLEFAMGGNPLLADAALAQLQPVAAAPGNFAFVFRERTNLGDVQRQFEMSTNLVEWQAVSPASLTVLSNSPETGLFQAVFPAQSAASFFRLKFLEPVLNLPQ